MGPNWPFFGPSTQGTSAWSISSSKYIQDAIKNVEHRLDDMGMKLMPGHSSPLHKEYRPEIDVSPLLDASDANFYQSLIGSLRWMVEMGRIDICCEVSIMSSCLAMPRQGHLQQVLQIFSYLKKHHNSRIIMDPTYPDISTSVFSTYDWENHYDVGRESIPPNAPEPLGQSVQINCFVDASHANNLARRRS